MFMMLVSHRSTGQSAKMMNINQVYLICTFRVKEEKDEEEGEKRVTDAESDIS